MRLFLRILFSLAVALAVVGLSGPPTMGEAQTVQKKAAKKKAPKMSAPKKQAPQDVARFDGTWSVLIVTEAGTCDRAYRYSVRIVQGTVRYGGETPVTLTGGVEPSGRVTVSLSLGQASAQGSGQLSGDEGNGTWSGHTANAQCSGYWEAERRGR